MKVVVYGAEGWTGRAVLANLTGKHEIRAFAFNPEAWTEWNDLDGEWNEGEIVFGDISDFATVEGAMEGMDAAVHLSRFGGAYDENATGPFVVNLKGLWNVLECAQRRNLRRVVHIGSCQTVHRDGIFFSSEVRRPDGSLYGITKRLQEEMCRQFHDAFGLRIIVLRPDYIVDSRLGLGRSREKLGKGGRPYRNGWVCRHDLAEAIRLSLENETADFDILHTVGTKEADKTCNVARTREVLGMEFKGDLEQFRVD